MKREVQTNELLPLYDMIRFVQANYPLDRSQRSRLAGAATVIFALAHQPAVKPLDVDSQYPLLARCNGRTAEDCEAIQEASRMLLGSLATHEVGERLRRLQGDEDPAAGWRWLRAAHVLLGPKIREDLRGSWGYFAGIARGFREADRDRPLRASELPETSVDEIRRLLAS